VKELRQGEFKEFVGSHVAQKIGIRAFSGISKLISGKAKRVRFKKKSEFFSFEGKDNKSFLRLIHPEGELPRILLRNTSYFLRLDPECNYQKHALCLRCKFVRIVKRRIQGRVQYYVQLVCEGTPFQDLSQILRHEKKMESYCNQDSSQASNTSIDPKFQKVVCLDFGPKKVAISTLTHGFERDICQGLRSRQKKIRLLQRALDRSQRAMNPDKYNPDGTIQRGQKKWSRSKRYLKLQTEVAELYRKQAAHRKSVQGELANDILVLGNCIKLEKVSYQGFQKLYGKAVGMNAPANLQGILTRKAENARGRVEKINTFDTQLSQTCLCGNIQKKPLHQRTHACSHCGLGTQEVPVSRDLFSAFLGIFTENTEIRKGKSVSYSSRLNLEQARLALYGHRILSPAGLKSNLQIQTSEDSSSMGVEQSASEDSAEIATNPFLEFIGPQIL
jgi:transposase